MATNETISLLDYMNGTEYPVLFWVSAAVPTGELTPLCHPDLDLAIERGWDRLEGTVGEDGRWSWDHEGSPRDPWQNSVRSLSAYPDESAWNRLVREYETDV